MTEGALTTSPLPRPSYEATLGGLVVLCAASIFLFTAQAGASFTTYLLAIAVVAAPHRWGPPLRPAMPVLLLALALLIYLPASAAWSPEPDGRAAVSAFTAAALTAVFLIGFAHALGHLPRLETWLARGVTPAGAIAAAAAITCFYVNEPPSHGRLQGLGQITNSVMAAQAYGIALLFALHSAFAERGAWRFPAWLAAAVLLVAIMLTDVRAVQFALLVGLTGYALSYAGLSPRRYVAGLIGLVTIVVLASALLVMLNPQWVELLFPRGDSFRLGTWHFHLERSLAEGLWLGQGILADRSVTVDGREVMHPHSLFLSVFVQGGIIALGLLLALLTVTLTTLLRHRERPMARLGTALLLTGIVAFALDGSHLIDKVSTVWLLIWMPVAIALVYWHRPSVR